MRCAKSKSAATGFTLVEMLVVIAIIGILAALLFPALTGGKKRAKRILCETQLQQIGLAFQSFSHDHNSKFPMQAGITDGGSEEYVADGNSIAGDFNFGYRHFQTLAGTLQIPKILVCPADTRLPAANFLALQNSNLSYFVAVSARYDQPMSMLAGDGNLASSSTILHGSAGARLAWNRQLHEYKGNVLFSDGHVEEWGDTGSARLAMGSDIVLPTLGGSDSSVGQAAHNGSPAIKDGPRGANATAASAHDYSSTVTAARPNLPLSPAAAASQRRGQPATIDRSLGMLATAQSTAAPTAQAGMDASNGIAEQATVTNVAGEAQIVNSNAIEATMSPGDRKAASVMRGFLVGIYSLALLAVLAYASYRLWMHYQNPIRKCRSKLQQQNRLYGPEQ